MINKKHKMIVLEGIDKAGKSTLLNCLKEILPGNIISIRQPGQTSVGSELRDTVMRHYPMMEPEVRDLLFFADLKQTYNELSIMDSEDTWLTDRSWVTNVAYGEADGRDMSEYGEKALAVTGKPDLVVILTIDSELMDLRYNAGILLPIEDVDFDKLHRRQVEFRKACLKYDIPYYIIHTDVNNVVDVLDEAHQAIMTRVLND